MIPLPFSCLAYSVSPHFWTAMAKAKHGMAWHSSAIPTHKHPSSARASAPAYARWTAEARPSFCPCVTCAILAHSSIIIPCLAYIALSKDLPHRHYAADHVPAIVSHDLLDIPHSALTLLHLLLCPSLIASLHSSAATFAISHNNRGARFPTFPT